MTATVPTASLRAPVQPEAFHPGEQALQARVGVRERMAAVGAMVLRDHMPDQHRELFERLPTLLLGTLDEQGQPWATMLAGPPGFVHTPDGQHMQIATAPDSADPVLTQLAPGAAVGVLGLEPHTRRRNRMNGRVTAFGDQGQGQGQGLGQGLGVEVVKSFGNCPKYIQARQPGLRSALVAPGPVQRLGAELDAAAVARVQHADTLFIASASAPRPGAGTSEGVDVSYRGGEPGFVHVAHTAGGVVLSLPDYPGNQFFNTLGNLALHPLAGLLVVDYEEGGLLHIAAQAEVLWDDAARAPWPGAQRVLRLTVQRALWRPQVLPWRWTPPVSAPQFRVMREAALVS